METQIETDRRSYLLVSDLDDTLLGDEDALRRFHDAFLSEFADKVRLVYASGRFASSIRESVYRTNLPKPFYLIGGVGSEIRRFEPNEPLQEWEEKISENWSAESVRNTLADLETLRLQAEEHQSEFKVSYLFPNATREHVDDLNDRLKHAGLDVSCIYSSRRDLDILPRGVNKGTAAEFLAQHLGVPPERVLTAGNSGNDHHLMEHGFSGIVVANAHADLRDRARHNPRVYEAIREMADGVAEGVRYWMDRLEDSDES